MLLLLVRHCEAVDHAADDASRQLTGKGIEQAGRVARFCRRERLAPDLILSSPLLRAKQTAAVVAEALDIEMVFEESLRGGRGPDEILNAIEGYQKFETVMVVGHEPDFSSLVARLLGVADPEALNVRKGSLIGIECARLCAGGGELQFFVPGRLMD